MPIKYAEITIVKNLKEESWFNYCKRLIGNENIVSVNDIIIILFEDKTISNVKREYVDKHFVMGPRFFQSVYPIYFNKKKDYSLFLKIPSYINGLLTLDFKPIFKDNPNYPTLTKVPSIYNAIYESANNDMFAIIKIYSNEKSPRYLLAYGDNYFEHSDIIYFVEYIFKNTID